jgi:nucleotide-binding universal stress UspA family protein
VFGVVFNTRQIHYFTLAGMLFLAAGVLVLLGAVPPTQTLALVGSGLIGIGIGASVAPALFLAGFSLRAASIQRVFAILELLRAVAAFMIVPILLHFATTAVGTPTSAMRTALWVCFGLSVGGAIVGVGLYMFGRVRPVAPSVDTWMKGMEPGWYSPPLSRSARPVLAEAAAPARQHEEASDQGEHPGPVLFAYDGSVSAKDAITEAGRQLPAGRDVLVLTVWRTFGVGFLPDQDTPFDAASSQEVGEAASQTAEAGAALARSAGFQATGQAVEGTPVWQAILDAADEHQVSLIILGAGHHPGPGVLSTGSVATAVATRSPRPVLIVHEHSQTHAPAA